MNVGLAVGLSVGLIGLFLFIGIPICVVVVGACVVANRRGKPVTRTHTVATAPPAAGTTLVEKQYPADGKPEPLEAPPPYPGGSYPAYPSPAPQVQTSL